VQSFLPQLQDAQRRKQLVQLSRRFEDMPIRGYVLAIGPSFFLIAIVSDRIRFDGFECFRLADLLKVNADPNIHFVETALRKRRERMPQKPSVRVTSICELLRTAARAFPLITIHREEVDPTVCWIGRVCSVSKDQLSLLEINPDATWEKSPATYPLDEITRVNFAGDYENALHLVATEPSPQIESRRIIGRKPRKNQTTKRPRPQRA
jgi:hypothetical protein